MAEGLVRGAHRLIRALDRGEGPYPGVLVQNGEGAAVLRDAADLADWKGWGYAGSAHIAGPLDLCRREDGLDVLLPWCTERVLVFLARRSAAGAGLAGGEVATLAGSVLRGLRALSAEEDDPPGEWWLSAEGRPLFVHGAGEGAREGAAEIFERIAATVDDRAFRRLLAVLAEQAVHPRILPVDVKRWEDELCALAAPRPLQRATEGEVMQSIVQQLRTVPSRAAGRRTVGSPLRRQAMRVGRPSPGGSRLRTLRQAAGQGVALLRERIGALRLGVQRRMAGRDSASRGSRVGVRAERGAGIGSARAEGTRRVSGRRRVLVFASAAAAVLLVGVLWPTEGTQNEASGTVPAVAGASSAEATERESGASGGENAAERSAPPEVGPSTESGDGTASSAAERTETTGNGSGSDTESATEEDGAETSPEVGAEEAVPALLDGMAQCANAPDDACAVTADGSASQIDGLAAEGSAVVSGTLVDDFGDLVVVRLAAVDGSAGAQMIVLVRQKQLWLVRDIYDVSHQPEEAAGA